MNKKLIALTTGLVIGGGLLLGTTYANASQLSGYESYKMAIKDTTNLKNFTANAKVTVYDNGSKLMDANSNIKINKDGNAISENNVLNENGKTITMSNYRQDGKNITKTSESAEYTVMEGKNGKFKEKSSENTQITKGMEIVVDTLAGDMKNGVVTSDNGNGTKNVTINLNEKEITPAVNAIVSMALGNCRHGEMDKIKGGVEANIPQLQDDITIKSVQATANIDKNDIILNQTAKITVVGKDAQGKQHEITIDANVDLTNINSTTPDKVDLTGKQVKTITPGMRHNKE